MKEKIILAPGLSAGEVLKSLAINGVNTFNLRVMNAAQLAAAALMKSGIINNKILLSREDEYLLTSRAVKGVDYFHKYSFSDIVCIANAIRQMRSFAAENEEGFITTSLGEGIFKEKNEALLIVYRNYMKLLEEENSIDNISLVRKALDECKKLEGEFFCLEEYPMTPLEKALLEKLSGGEFEEINLHALYKAKNKRIRTQSIINCYGAPNEAEMIIDDIYRNKRLDTCTIAVTDFQTYSQLFFDLAVLNNIPVTFGCGIPVSSSNPARLLRLRQHWATDGFFGAQALEKMLNDNSFDKAKLYSKLEAVMPGYSKKELCGLLYPLRLKTDKAENEAGLLRFAASCGEKGKPYLPLLNIISDILSMPLSEFINEFAYIRKNTSSCSGELVMHLDISARKAVCSRLKMLEDSDFNSSELDIVPEILKMSVCSQSSKEGAIHVTSLSGAAAVMRENLYVAGLSASKFPGSPKENYLLLDDDIENFGEGAERFTSENIITEKKEQLKKLIRTASGLNCNINLSYAGMNVSELKKDNASSVIYELFREEYPDSASSGELEKHIRKTGYFEPAVTKWSDIGKAYNLGREIVPGGKKEKNDEACDFKAKLNDEYSPSALNVFFGCPRRFMLSYILGINENEEINPFTVIPSNDEGTLAHELMEMLSEKTMTYEEFIREAEKRFDSYIALHPPLIEHNAEKAKADFVEMMTSAYETDPHRDVVLAEEDIHFCHESGVKIHGLPDRVEKLESGKYLVVDYKSGRNVKHTADDIDTCLQGAIYAYLMERSGYDVEGCEFRYIRIGETVSCVWNDEMKEKLNTKLSLFKDMFINGDFPCTDKEDNCKYCTFAEICGKNKEEEA